MKHNYALHDNRIYIYIYQQPHPSQVFRLQRLAGGKIFWTADDQYRPSFMLVSFVSTHCNQPNSHLQGCMLTHRKASALAQSPPFVKFSNSYSLRFFSLISYVKMCYLCLFPYMFLYRNHYLCAVYAARLMVPRREGLIVNISSPGGLSYLFNVPYGVGKEAVS